MENYVLKKPIEFEGKKIESFNFDFKSMTRKEYRHCIKEAYIRDKKGAETIPIFGETFRLVFASKSAGVPTEAMFLLSPKDIVAISEKVFSYFFGEDDEDIDFDINDDYFDDENTYKEDKTYKLKDPIEFNGETITELKFDFDSINYYKYKECEREAAKINSKVEATVISTNNENFQLCFAAKAAGIDKRAIFKLSLRDSFNVCIMARNFLSNGGSEEKTATTVSPTLISTPQKKNVKTVDH